MTDRDPSPSTPTDTDFMVTDAQDSESTTTEKANSRSSSSEPNKGNTFPHSKFNTVPTNVFTSLTQGKTQLVLKWVISAQNHTAAQTVHSSTLLAIKLQFGDKVDIVSNITHQIVKGNSTYNDANEYEKLFTMKAIPQRQQTNKKSKQQELFEIHHRIYTSYSLASIKKEKEIQQQMRSISHNCKIEVHLWTEDVQDVREVGWLYGFTPGYQLSDQVEELIQQAISHSNKIATKQIPKFKCRKTSISAAPSNDNQQKMISKTFAFAIQCRAKDTRKLIKLLQNTYASTGQFLEFKNKYNYPIEYAKAILSQNTFIANHRVVTIQGIPPDHMWTFDEYLKSKNPLVKQVLRTKRSQEDGRYNLLTSNRNIQTLAKDMHNTIASIYEEFLQDSTTQPQEKDDRFPWPPTMESKKLLRNSDFSDSESWGQTDSIASAGSSVAFWSTATVLSRDETIPGVHRSYTVPEVGPAPTNEYGYRAGVRCSGNTQISMKKTSVELQTKTIFQGNKEESEKPHQTTQSFRDRNAGTSDWAAINAMTTSTPTSHKQNSAATPNLQETPSDLTMMTDHYLKLQEDNSRLQDNVHNLKEQVKNMAHQLEQMPRMVHQLEQMPRMAQEMEELKIMLRQLLSTKQTEGDAHSSSDNPRQSKRLDSKTTPIRASRKTASNTEHQIDDAAMDLRPDSSSPFPVHPFLTKTDVSQLLNNESSTSE